MKLNLKCVPCYVNQVLQAAELLGVDEKTKEQMAREALQAVSGFKIGEHAFYTFNLAQEVVRRHEPKKDPYRGLKKKFNRMCLNLEDEVKEMIANSSDRFQTALRIAIAGNIIDFVKILDMDEQTVRDTIKDALSQDLNQEKIKLLKDKIREAKKILYVGDNAGEIVFDKVFIEEFNGSKVVFAVRGGPVMNDATMEDAREVGLADTLKVITTGTDLPGAMLNLASPQFKEEFKAADLVISKGQGNYEALSGEDKEIFFLLKVKCPVISESLGYRYQVGDIVIDDLR
ncbi:MAG: damage-control phosphatase ARMT1 family protein [Actinomycetota bacterium]